MSLFYYLLLGIACALLVFLIRKAPFIDPDWKEYLSYGILVVFVLWIISQVLGFPVNPFPRR